MYASRILPKSLPLLASLMLMLQPLLAADAPKLVPLTPEEQTFFQQQPDAATMSKEQRVSGPELEKAFAATFYQVNIRLSSNASQKLVFARTGSSLVKMELPTSTASMPDLLKLLKPDFKLKTMADAKVLVTALDDIYPLIALTADEKTLADTVQQSGDSWTFIRGAFFKRLKGIICTTNADGVITEIKFSLDIPRPTTAAPAATHASATGTAPSAATK